MFTANSMNCLCEALGIALPGNGTILATSPERHELAKRAATRLLRAACTRATYASATSSPPRAIDNAIALDVAMGGSTNTVLHVLALAHEAELDYPLARFNEVAERMPHLAKISPAWDGDRQWHMQDVDAAGGIPAILAELAKQAGHPRSRRADRDRHDARRAAAAASRTRTPTASARIDNPHSERGALCVLFGSLAPARRGDQGRRGVAARDDLPRTGARVRQRGSGARRGDRRRDPRRRRDRRAQRGAARRPRHARDAVAHVAAQGHADRRERRADHRRPLLRRHARPVHRPRLAGSGGGRTDRAASATATSSPSTSPRESSTSRWTRVAELASAGAEVHEGLARPLRALVTSAHTARTRRRVAHYQKRRRSRIARNGKHTAPEGASREDARQEAVLPQEAEHMTKATDGVRSSGQRGCGTAARSPAARSATHRERWRPDPLRSARSARASTRSSASRAARSCRSTTRCPSTPISCTTCSAATSRARVTRPRATRARRDASACASATSGPGATNLVTPIADAWMDSTPLVALTGQVSSALLGTDAFQETDIIGITVPITKHSYLVRNATRHPARRRRGVSHRRDRPARARCSSTSPRTRSRRASCPNWDVKLDLEGYVDHRVARRSIRRRCARRSSCSRRRSVR